MVFFTCDACGESLKKSQVEKHLLKCHRCQALSCIDCGKDFCGDDYKNHIRCVSEDQKYGGKDFQAKARKGDVKQQQWIERIHEAVQRPDVQPRLRQVLQQVSAYDNVPRKRAKFQNWMKNSLRINSPDLLEQVWDIFSTAADSDSRQTNHHLNQSDRNNGTEEKIDKQKRNPSEEENGQNTCKKQSRKKRKREEREQNGQNADEKNNKKQKKRKEEAFDESLNLEEAEPVSQDTESNHTGKFNWKGTIKAVLRDAPEDGLAVKKLRKKVLSAYHSFTGDGNYRSEEELLSLFSRKINNNPKFKILKEKVRLVK